MAEKKINVGVDALADEMEVKLLRLDPADVYDPAILGIVERAGNAPFLVYDRERVIRQMMEHDGVTYTDAAEWHEYNTFDAWLGDGTPAFLTWSANEE